MSDLLDGLPPMPYLRRNTEIVYREGREIRVSYDPPSGPGWEKMAWKASWGDRDGRPVGYGATVAEAVDDLTGED